MLYDFKRWEKPEVKADPFSLEGFIAWMETKPSSESYCFYESGECLVGQYVKTIDAEAVPTPHMGSDYYTISGNVVNMYRFVDLASGEFHTFGAALERARAALEKSRIS